MSYVEEICDSNYEWTVELKTWETRDGIHSFILVSQVAVFIKVEPIFLTRNRYL